MEDGGLAVVCDILGYIHATSTHYHNGVVDPTGSLLFGHSTGSYTLLIPKKEEEDA